MRKLIQEDIESRSCVKQRLSIRMLQCGTKTTTEFYDFSSLFHHSSSIHFPFSVVSSLVSGNESVDIFRGKVVSIEMIRSNDTLNLIVGQILLTNRSHSVSAHFVICYRESNLKLIDIYISNE